MLLQDDIYQLQACENCSTLTSWLKDRQQVSCTATVSVFGSYATADFMGPCVKVYDFWGKSRPKHGIYTTSNLT